MIKLGNRFPSFNLEATVSSHLDQAFTRVTDGDHPNQWKVYFFWPKDFTFVCPTEIKAFNDQYEAFADRDAVLIGGSTDSAYVHLAWRQAKEELQDLKFPMLSDIKGELARALGIDDEEEGVMQRATIIVDPHNTVRFVMANDMNVGRNPQEVLRVLDALQTDELCPCNWQPGDATLTPQSETTLEEV
jgi:lipoyl-dependent peroxiredoxin subunit C